MTAHPAPATSRRDEEPCRREVDLLTNGWRKSKLKRSTNCRRSACKAIVSIDRSASSSTTMSSATTAAYSGCGRGDVDQARDQRAARRRGRRRQPTHWRAAGAARRRRRRVRAAPGRGPPSARRLHGARRSPAGPTTSHAAHRPRDRPGQVRARSWPPVCVHQILRLLKASPIRRRLSIAPCAVGQSRARSRSRPVAGSRRARASRSHELSSSEARQRGRSAVGIALRELEQGEPGAGRGRARAARTPRLRRPGRRRVGGSRRSRRTRAATGRRKSFSSSLALRAASSASPQAPRSFSTSAWSTRHWPGSPRSPAAPHQRFAASVHSPARRKSKRSRQRLDHVAVDDGGRVRADLAVHRRERRFVELGQPLVDLALRDPEAAEVVGAQAPSRPCRRSECRARGRARRARAPRRDRPSAGLGGTCGGARWACSMHSSSRSSRLSARFEPRGLEGGRAPLS